MSRLAAGWRRYWFTPGEAVDLAIPRILVCGFLLHRNWGTTGEVVDSPFFEELWRPISFFGWLAEHAPSADTVAHVAGVWKLALAFACIGLLTRTSVALAFLLGTFVVGWEQNFGKVMHSHHVALLCTGILAFSRCGDAWSVDAWLRQWRGATRAPAAPSSEYTWPIRCAWLVMMLMFLAAGVAKLRNGGLEWIFSDSFSRMLILKHYEKPVDLNDLGLYVAQLGWLCQLLAFASVAIELGAPLALVSRRLRLLLVPALFGMQVGIAVLMGVHSRSPNFACYSFWIPWHALLARFEALPRRAPAREPPPAASNRVGSS